MIDNEVEYYFLLLAPILFIFIFSILIKGIIRNYNFYKLFKKIFIVLFLLNFFINFLDYLIFPNYDKEVINLFYPFYYNDIQDLHHVSPTEEYFDENIEDE